MTTPSAPKDDRAYENAFIARQPILDSNLNTWGYLLLFRDSEDATRAVYSDDMEATMRVVANLPLCPNGLAPGSKLMVHFPGRSLSRNVPQVLPPERTVVLLQETEEITDYFLDAVRSLKEEGYMIAVDNYVAKPGSAALCGLADILVVDILGLDKPTLTGLVREAQALGAPRLLAKRVETMEALELVRECGFSLFQGFFFKEPKTLAGRSITSSEITRLRLFEIIERDEPNFDALTPAIEADVSISYRLLTFLNSASFAFAKKITSIRQAVVLTGWKPIRNWLRLIILTDLLPSEKSRELTYLSAHRAKLFETAALGGGYEAQSDSLFMLGLFSLLSPMFDMPMAKVVKHLPLADELKAALCGESNEFSPWLDLAAAIEASDWETVGKTAKKLNLPPGTVAVSYQHAYAWVDSFFGSALSECATSTETPPQVDEE